MNRLVLEAAAAAVARRCKDSRLLAYNDIGPGISEAVYRRVGVKWGNDRGDLTVGGGNRPGKAELA